MPRKPHRAAVVRALSLAAGIGCMLHASAAAADVTSWLSAGGGYGLQHDDGSKRYAQAGAASFAIGVGSDPTRRLVVGGVLRSTTYFTLGTDIGVAARFATGGFARGQWGLAAEVGPTLRTFGSGEYGRWPISAKLIGGAPWGLQLAIGGDVARIAGEDAQARGVVAVLELDLLRLTVMRHGATDRWWPNPSPAGGKLTPPSRALAGLLW
jgi:hypothetical protein